MENETRQSPRYRLSFTVGGLLARESLLAVPMYLETRDWQSVRSGMDSENTLQARTVSSAQRLSRELTQRLSTLTDREIELIPDSTSEERCHLMWAAACRQYELIGDFAEEVLRERFLLLTPNLTPEHFESFLRTKSMWHEELEKLTGSTQRKLRTNLYRMLREAGLLSQSGSILPCIISTRVAECLDGRTPSDTRFFPTIANIERKPS